MANDVDPLDDETPGSWTGSNIIINKREEESNMFFVHDHLQQRRSVDFLKEENGTKTSCVLCQVNASTAF